MENVLLIFGLIIGILCCLFGLQFQKGILTLIGLALGFTLGEFIVESLSLTGGLELVVEIGSALALGIFSFTLFETLLAVIVAVGLFIVVSEMIDNNILGYIVGGISAIIGGLLTHKFYKLGVVIFTSICGSYLVSNFLVNHIDCAYSLIFGAVLVVSIVFQSINNKLFSK